MNLNFGQEVVAFHFLSASPSLLFLRLCLIFCMDPDYVLDDTGHGSVYVLNDMGLTTSWTYACNRLLFCLFGPDFKSSQE